MSEIEFKTLRLKKNMERRIRGGHVWIYSNEIDTQATPLNGFEAGDLVQVLAGNGKVMGTGYINPHSLISVRLLSRDAKHPISPSLFVHRVKVALGLRERLYDRPFYRLVYGDSDELPGLVVDRYDDVLVAQTMTAGMEALKPMIEAALKKVLKPSALVWRNDSKSRQAEGLTQYKEMAFGELDGPVVVEEGNARYSADLFDGQKTGWFYDQRENRARLARYIAAQTTKDGEGPRVLDLFSYAGGWGIRALLDGAREAMCVDSSETALDRAEAGAQLSGVDEKLITVQGNVFEVLKVLREERERFDIVIVDPPAFIKRKKDYKEGYQAYKRVNQGAMQILSRDGIIVSCSCSYHLQRDSLRNLVGEAARHVDRELQILEHGQQGPDHPMHPVIAETEYLKAIFARARQR